MCIGSADLDTLGLDEQLFLREAAAERCPSHRFSLEANRDGQSWVVLEPTAVRPDLLRFTICRIAPCVMVLVEDCDRRRQICSTSCVEDAMNFACNSMDQAILAVMNAHPAHPVPQ